MTRGGGIEPSSAPGPRALLIVAVLGASGCTFEPGRGFGSVRAWSLGFGLEAGAARDLGDGWVLTAEGHEVHLASLEVEVGEVAIERLSGGAASFDPANPPEGYTICHSGHCDSVDGRLVPYAEIEAELAGGGASFVASASAALEDALALGEWVDFPAPIELVEGDLRRVRLGLVGLVGEGTWRPRLGGGGLGEGQDFRIAWQGSADWTAAVDLPLDRDHDPWITLTIDAGPEGQWFDGAFNVDADGPDVGVLVERMIATPPRLDIQREPEGVDQ